MPVDTHPSPKLGRVNELAWVPNIKLSVAENGRLRTRFIYWCGLFHPGWVKVYLF